MSLILGGAVVQTQFPSKNWEDHGLTFRNRVGKHGAQARPRVARLELGVLHCTGDEEDGAESFFRNLASSGYSVEFHLDGFGTLWQFLDPVKESALHVGGLNSRALGVEIENPMRPVRGVRPRSKQIVQVVGEKPGPFPGDFKIDKNQRRLYYRRSNRIECLGLFPKQLETLRQLPPLFAQFGIPTSRADTRDYIPKAERGPALRGWLGHVQVTLGHGDPSLDSLEQLF